MAQADAAAAALVAAGAESVELLIVETRGDRDRSTPVAMMEGQGWFTGEVERSLMEGRADVAVHSAKDLPTTLGPGLEVAAIPLRGDPCDAVVSADGSALDDLPAGATVGTSSERRQAMVRALHPRLRAVNLRGNVDTRLAKLEAGEVD
ncbi:MAG TPA: hydroxymethylbilane synthase, partial [Candidatus Sulfotelmatobacter sp.]|nr:hydroxymethylbilane synthase [Candidatus Sulfotelmatobacter sp.]